MPFQAVSDVWCLPRQTFAFPGADARTEQTFKVPAAGCSMQWQRNKLSQRTWTAHSVPLSTVVGTLDQAEPAFIKIDVDGSEISVIEAIVELLPTGPKGSSGSLQNRFAQLPELYVEVDSSDWSRFGTTRDAGLAALTALGSRYTEIYLFAAMSSACEGTSLRAHGRNLTRPFRALKGNYVWPRELSSWEKLALPLRILRVVDAWAYEALLKMCVGHKRQLNLWFAS